MFNMINLIRNESMKLSHRISTWIMIGILVIIVLAAGLIMRFGVPQTNNSNWKAQLTKQNEEMKNTLKVPNMNKTTKKYLNEQIKIADYEIQHNIPPTSSNSLWGFVGTTSNAISFISLFAIIIGGGMVANEFSGGTIKLLLIRPSKRWKILISKYITVLMYTLLMLLVLFIASFIIGGILFSFAGANSPYLKYINGGIVEVNMTLEIFGVYGLKCIDLLMMATLAFMISTVFRNSSLAIGIGVFLLFSGSILIQILRELNIKWIKYILFANTDLTQYITSGKQPPVQGMTMSFSIIVILVYFLVFNIISFWGFLKRDVTA